MLSYFRYFAVISFLLVLVAAFFAGMYFRLLASDRVVQNPIVEDYLKIAKYYEKNIWCRYEPYIRRLESSEIVKWKDDENFAKFSKLSETILNANPAAKINLINEDGKRFFSNNDLKEVRFDEAENPVNIFNNVFAGNIFNEVVSPMALYNKEDMINKGSYLHILLPIRVTDCDSKHEERGVKKLRIIMEVYYDITVPWNNLAFFQTIVTAGIIITFIVLYLALFYTSRKAERIINKQHEEKLELEKAKTVAETQNQQKSMFLANVSHELRTPLNAIIGFSEIIKDEVMGAVGHPQYKEYINDINASGVHLLSLINDILDYSKAEAKKLDVEEVDVDITKIADSCLRLVEPRANEAKVRLIENMPKQHVVLNADPKRMKQIILNLLSNAVKFTPEDGEITLSIKEEILENKVYITVSDTGIGISHKDISKAMSPFGQIDSSLSRRYEGTGLGLPLTKKLTDIMGGKFDIRSEVGLGTTITLIFPLKKDIKKGSSDNF